MTTGGCLASCDQSFTKADQHRMLFPRPVPLQPGVPYKISAAIRVLGCHVLGLDEQGCQMCITCMAMSWSLSFQHSKEQRRVMSVNIDKGL